jgi:hypothetical protein
MISAEGRVAGPTPLAIFTKTNPPEIIEGVRHVGLLSLLKTVEIFTYHDTINILLIRGLIAVTAQRLDVILR